MTEELEDQKYRKYWDMVFCYGQQNEININEFKIALWQCPTEALCGELNPQLEHCFVINFDNVKLIQEAIAHAYSQLEHLRFEGLDTHRDAEGKAHLLRKLLKMLFHALIEHFSSNNPVQEIFIKRMQNTQHDLEYHFHPIFETLTGTFTRREKQLLLRAFWENFIRIYNHYFQYDFQKLYTGFYEQVYSQYQHLKQVEAWDKAHESTLEALKKEFNLPQEHIDEKEAKAEISPFHSTEEYEANLDLRGYY